MNYLVETIAVDDQGKEVKDKKKATLESNVRKKHTAVFKAKVIHQVQPNVPQDQIAQKYGISLSLVSKWLKIAWYLQPQISIENFMRNKENQLNIWNCKDYFLISLKQHVVKAEKWTSTGYEVKFVQFKESHWWW